MAVSRIQYQSITLLLIILCCLFPTLSGCVKRGGPPNFGPMSVDISPVKIQDITQYFETIGSVINEENVVLKAETEGRVQSILCQEGDKVSPGQVLLLVDNTKLISEVKGVEASIIALKSEKLSLTEQNNQAKASIKIEEASLKKASADYHRYKELFKKEFISRMELDQVEANYNIAVAKVESTQYYEASTINKIKSVHAQLNQLLEQLKVKQVNLNNAEIKSPKEGIIDERFVAEGEYVTPGEKLLSLTASSVLKIKFSLPENYLSRIHTGYSIFVTLDKNHQKPKQAKITFVSPKIDEATRQFSVKADLNIEKQINMRSGMFVQVKIPVSRDTKSIIVPEESIISIGNLTYVYVYKDGKAILRNIKTGLREKGKVQILTGIDQNTHVITSGHQKLRDGVPVKPRTPLPKDV